jgi:hypothetical protein
MTDSMWVTLKISVEGRLHLFYDQQFVSDIAQFVKAGLITPFPLINREWVRLVILLRTVSSHLCLLSTGGKGHCLLCEGQSHHICFYDQQEVSGPDIAHVVKGSLITSVSIINREWVTLHIVWKAVSSHLLLWPTVCEWQYTFWEAVASHLFIWPTESEWDHSVKGSCITSFPMINSLWVTLHILSHVVSSIFSYDQ